MYSRILVPFDGSHFAAQAVPYARLIAGAFRAEVVLFQAVPDLPERTSPPPAGSPVTLEPAEVGPWLTEDQRRERHDRLQREATNDLQGAAEALRADGLAAQAVLGEGDPAEAIAREASAHPDTLIVMTTHGRSGILRWWLGSVTDKTVRLAAAPMLVVRCQEDQRAPAEPRIQRIVLPLDGSKLAEQAVPHAAALAEALGARVEVLRALGAPMYMPAQYPVVGAIPYPGTEREPAAEEYLEGIVAHLQASGAATADARALQGEAATVITDAAESAPDSLVVMSTHGRSGIGRWVIGSVADKVVRHGSRPVLLVRAREEAAAQQAA